MERDTRWVFLLVHGIGEEGNCFLYLSPHLLRLIGGCDKELRETTQ